MCSLSTVSGAHWMPFFLRWGACSSRFTANSSGHRLVAVARRPAARQATQIVAAVAIARAAGAGVRTCRRGAACLLASTRFRGRGRRRRARDLRHGCEKWSDDPACEHGGSYFRCASGADRRAESALGQRVVAVLPSVVAGRGSRSVRLGQTDSTSSVAAFGEANSTTYSTPSAAVHDDPMQHPASAQAQQPRREGRGARVASAARQDRRST